MLTSTRTQRFSCVDHHLPSRTTNTTLKRTAGRQRHRPSAIAIAQHIIKTSYTSRTSSRPITNSKSTAHHRGEAHITSAGACWVPRAHRSTRTLPSVSLVPVYHVWGLLTSAAILVSPLGPCVVLPLSLPTPFTFTVLRYTLLDSLTRHLALLVYFHLSHCPYHCHCLARILQH